jgi:glycosyltransferase involved in cell wall biosynthesis
VDGATVRYLATPLRFRWMGFTPTLPLVLRRLPRPDVVHVLGLRDPLGSAVALWCRRASVPYVFEGLGMYRPKLRKVVLKRLLDATLVAHVAGGAARVIAASDRERAEYLGGGIPPERISVRPNGFPEVRRDLERGALRRRLGLDARTPLILSVGRIARGKGLELLVDALGDLDAPHLAVVGPDGGHGLLRELQARAAAAGVAERLHLVGAVEPELLPALYADADVFVLASEHENFGMVAAEAAAVGAPIVVTDRCGVAELLGDRGALVVPYSRTEISAAIRSVLGDDRLRAGLGEGARAVASEWSWPRVADLQEALYRRALADA